MNRLSEMPFKPLLLALVFMAALLAGCTSDLPLTICHATGDPTKPYEQKTLSIADIQEHLAHTDDLYPVPEDGCPTSLPEETTETQPDAKLTICHATGSQTNPYEELTVSASALNGHDKHAGDIIPAPEGGCPAAPPEDALDDPQDAQISICHATGDETTPYETLTLSAKELKDHKKHDGDLIPAPEGGCPSAPPEDALDDPQDAQVIICHATGDETTPYETLTLSAKDLKDHKKHDGDLIPAPEGGCPTALPEETTQTQPDAKVTICHATGSKKNAYVEITVSVNGLNGHGNHPGDIIPAPAGGCPVVKKK